MPKLDDFSFGKYSIGGGAPESVVLNLDGFTSGTPTVAAGSTGFKGSLVTVEANKKLISMVVKNVSDGAGSYVGGAYGMAAAFALQDLAGNVWQLTTGSSQYLHLLSLSLDLVTGLGYYLYRLSTGPNNPSTGSSVLVGSILPKPAGFNASNSYLLFGVTVVIASTTSTSLNFSGNSMTMKQM